ncbi:MAG: peptidoglycan-binding protein [Lentisphaeria bacterium]|nr:peptidoglycan-binding protein [Lentisphaeria bacterium]
MTYTTLLKRGSSGPSVALLQRRLIELGYGLLTPAGRSLVADGHFGPMTEEALCEFQMRHTDSAGNALSVDGIAGPLTWQALFPGTAAGLPETAEPRSESERFMAATLVLAATQEGVRESPPNSNRGPEVDQYLASVGLAPGHAWCAAFVYWCSEQAARNQGRAGSPLLRTGWTPSIWSWAKARSADILPEDVLSGARKLVPGTLFLLHGAVDGVPRVKHVGLVSSAGGGWVHTIEGNTNPHGSRSGGGVCRLRRKISTIFRFVTYG